MRADAFIVEKKAGVLWHFTLETGSTRLIKRYLTVPFRDPVSGMHIASCIEQRDYQCHCSESKPYPPLHIVATNQHIHTGENCQQYAKPDELLNNPEIRLDKGCDPFESIELVPTLDEGPPTRNNSNSEHPRHPNSGINPVASLPCSTDDRSETHQ